MPKIPSHIREEFERYVRNAAPDFNLTKRGDYYSTKPTNALWELWVYSFHYGLDEQTNATVEKVSNATDKYASMAARAAVRSSLKKYGGI